jgi:hypothetical protein
VAVNGEIYNHKALKAKILEKHPNKKFNTQSDCEVRAPAASICRSLVSWGVVGCVGMGWATAACVCLLQAYAGLLCVTAAAIAHPTRSVVTAWCVTCTSSLACAML